MKNDARPTIIMGLGNPEPALADTYHNIGLRAVHALAEYATRAGGDDAPLPPKSYKDLFLSTTIGGRTFVFPLVYMNNSGRAAREALRVFHATPADLVVVHDDSDLTIGTFKFVRGGGAAGHNGVRSVIDHLKTEDFFRLRIGIRPANEFRRKKAGDFVLVPVATKDKKVFGDIFEQIAPLLGFSMHAELNEKPV